MGVFLLSCALLLASFLHFTNPQEQIPISLSQPSSIPSIGFGTWNLDKSNASEAVSVAIQTGYRHIDAAAIYGNEKEVGKGIQHGLEKVGLQREYIWITSKLWNDKHDTVESAIMQTLQDLRTDYLDLYLMHWPVASKGGKNSIEYDEAWKSMETLQQKRYTRQIGVSNFSPSQMKDLIQNSNTKPSVHQYELHPYLQQPDFVQWHKDNNINITAYSPLANLNPIYKSPDTPPSLLDNEQVSEIARKRGCSNAQLALAWGMGRGWSVIPKSQHEVRIVENFAATDCKLEDEDFDAFGQVGKMYLKRFNNPSKSWGVQLYEGLDDA